jgi:hypothetical protein
MSDPLRWINPSNKKPIENEQVLLRQERGCELAYYSSTKKVFILKDGKEVKDTAKGLKWLRLMPPSF